MPPPITSGLLWSTDVAIEFATSGPAVPAIPVARAAGPLYVIISYSQAVTPSEDEPTIFYVGSPSDNLYTASHFHAFRNWGTGIGIATTPGRGMMVELPAPPSDFVGEFWAASAGSNMVSYLTPGWYMDPIPDHNPVATSHLFIGYKPQDANPAWRGAGTIRRMAIYDRIPSAAERAQLVEWVQSQGAPLITATLAASDAPDTARIIASVRWPTITATVAAADAPDSAAIRATVGWPAIMACLAAADAPDTAAVSIAVPIRAALAATDPPDTAAIRAGTGWPAISARLAARDAPDRAAVVVAVAIRGALAAADAPDLARIIAGTGWPAIMARVAASDAPDRAAIRAAVPISARLAAGDAPDSARLSVAVRIGAVLDAADAPDMARIIMRLWSQSSRYAYPGDPQGGVVGPSARGGVLTPSIRSGTITRP
ncbi:hypothetical protein SAMN05444389_101452 [Paracoccus solventivorans]|uniref:Concanavalin A-like lectin/glucanases superfamily protein n=1 Tax=Paracoccus solventivorans TaxID=53463 RepID=A0A1M7DMX9_9RHOB|nr:hypothetical protein [Paracoccus solventivorans]SHL80832.1 hypothetical protein SAMN05444389_101452 [Paracoccus solventivorans]